MGSINMGYNLGVLNLAQPKLNLEYNLTENIALYKGKYINKIYYSNFRIIIMIKGLNI